MSWLTCTLPFTISESTVQRLHRPFIIGHIEEAWEHAISNPAYAGPRLSTWFRQKRSLGSRDRRIVSDAIYTLIRYQNLLQLAGFESVKERLAALVETDWVDSLSSENPASDLANACSVPTLIAADWIDQLGEQSQPLARSLMARAPIDLRAQSLSRQELAQQLRLLEIETSPIANSTNGLRVVGRANIQATSLFKQGQVEIQDASSQRFIDALGSLKGLTIWDMCCGAGGKALAMAAKGATVYATDPREHSVQELRRRAKRARIVIHTRPPSRAVDLVLVDAPCSGSGRLRREPTLRWLWLSTPPLIHVKLQRQLLAQASSHVAQGGRLVYATCSLIAAENDHSLPGWRCDKQVTYWPHQTDSDGFSWRCFRRTP